MNESVRARLEADALGLDIVGLKPGQPFDPIGDMDRAISQLQAEEAAAARSEAPGDSKP